MNASGPNHPMGRGTNDRPNGSRPAEELAIPRAGYIGAEWRERGLEGVSSGQALVIDGSGLPPYLPRAHPRSSFQRNGG
jgi:hypothetical protein